MDWCQMRYRCPSARFVDVALLPDHELAFTRWSENRCCGVADAVAAKGKEVWGVVYQIDERDVGALNKSEGFRPGRPKEENSYARELRHVFVDGDKRRPLEVEVYFANREDNPRPNQAYKDLILSGARHWHLPTDYVENVLDAIQVKRDKAPRDEPAVT